MHKLLVPILLTLAAVCRLYGATESYPVSGRVIDRLTRQPVPFAAVVISGQPGKGDGRLGRQIHDRSGEARHIPAVGVDAGLSERAHSGIHRFGRHAVHRNRARKRSAGNRNGHGHALSRPPHGEKVSQRRTIGLREIEKARVRTATSPASYAPIPESRFRP